MKQAGLDLDEMRARAAVLVDITPPELQKMRRVTTGALVQTGLLVLAFLVLVSGLGDLDLDQLAESIGDARWGYIAGLGVLVAQAPRVSQALSTLGASPIPIALGAALRLQLAMTYIGLAVPSAAGRVAMNIRFFQRHGLSSGAALAVGAIDSFAGFIVQVVLLIAVLLATPSTLDLDLDSASPSGIWRLLLIVVLVGLATIVAVLVVPKWRRFVFGWISTLLRQGLDAAKGLKDPRRLALLFGGNLVSELLFATALGLFVRGFGFDVGLAELILINVTVALFAGIIPVPGGIGVVEGGLTYGLVRAGMPEESAFAAAIFYRLAVFYLPPIWGFFAFRWLSATSTSDLRSPATQAVSSRSPATQAVSARVSPATQAGCRVPRPRRQPPPRNGPCVVLSATQGPSGRSGGRGRQPCKGSRCRIPEHEVLGQGVDAERSVEPPAASAVSTSFTTPRSKRSENRILNRSTRPMPATSPLPRRARSMKKLVIVTVVAPAVSVTPPWCSMRRLRSW